MSVPRAAPGATVGFAAAKPADQLASEEISSLPEPWVAVSKYLR